ncbi:MAG: hypothetical protein KJZ91_04390 [Myxococcales bacterium]|nr:hypothetical protein [Myxococcales bacterium]
MKSAGEELTQVVLDSRRGGQGLCQTKQGDWVHVSFGSDPQRHVVRGLPDMRRLETQHAVGGTFFSNSLVRHLLAEQYEADGKTLELSIKDANALGEVCSRLARLPDDTSERATAPPRSPPDAPRAPRPTVPITQLRYFYRTLLHLGRGARTEIAKSLAETGREVSLLEELFTDAIEHIDRIYKPSGEVPLMPTSGRKMLQAGKGTATDLVRHFEEHHSATALPVIAGGLSWTVRYLDREVSPLRTPGADWADGRKATSSGSGGIDVLGVTGEDEPHLVVGEIKAETDTDLFLALVQAFTYCSELMAGTAQQARVFRQYKDRLPRSPIAADIWLMFERKRRDDKIVDHVAAFIQRFLAQEDRASRQWLRNIRMIQVEAGSTFTFRNHFQ